MAGEVRFTIEGAAEMDRLLKQLGPEAAGRAGARALRAAARPIVQRAKELVPVDTGELRDSITAVVEPQRRRRDMRLALVGFTKPTSRRAHLTEYGTAHSPAKKFMRPALDEKHVESLNELGRVLADAINREAERLAGIRGRRRTSRP